MNKTLIDNSTNLKMVSVLRECISMTEMDTIRIATGYWDIPGTALVVDELQKFLERDGSKLKLLIGKDPYVYANMLKEPKYANKSYPGEFIRIGIDDLADNLLDEHKQVINLLLKYCDEENKKIEIRTFRKNEEDESQFLHSKCYIFTSESKKTQAYGIIGSSNFTEKGLQGNAELNYIEDTAQIVRYGVEDELKGHVGWFEEKWERAEDWTQEFLEQILKPSKPVQQIEEEKEKEQEELSAPLTPYELYIKLLQYKFGDLLDVDTTQVISSYLPKNFSPLEYQMDAVKQCFGIMKAHGGFMLADVVGLGKTIVGTLVIKYFLNYPDDGRERKVLIVTPPAIKKAWVDTIREFDKDSDDQIEPLIDFITTGSIGNLVDDEGDADTDSGEFEGTLEYHNYGLIIIDESHKFRNSGTQMYNALDELIAQIGANTGNYPYIGLLSATPQNNTPSDLKNQIYLFERNHQYCTLEKVDGRNLEAFFSDIMVNYSALRKEASAISAKEEKTPDDIHRLEEINEAFKQISATIRDTVLCDVLVRRTRTDIKKYYADDTAKQHLTFPTISGPHGLMYKMDDELSQLFADTMNLISPTPDFKFNNSDYLCYYRYRAIQYLIKPEDLQKYQGRGSRDPERVGEQLAKIMQILLVKRLESSFSAFTQSLLNLRNYTANMIRMWENNAIFICPQFDVNAELDEKAKTEKRGRKVTFAECADDIRARITKLNENGKNEKGQNAEYTRDDFNPAYIELLKADHQLICDLYDRWSKNTEDPKLDEFKEALKPVLFNPERNRPQKLVIFSEAIDTVNTLKRVCENKGFKNKVLAITAANRDEMQQKIQENFDANYKGEWKDDYQIIITTEVLAEGINLHRANCILNYDTPWNSTRLMQRIGRVNRIGSSEPYVYVYNFMPSAQGDRQIQLVEKAHIKLQSFHTLFGEDSKVFTEDETVEHYDLNDIVNGEESPYEQYIHQLKEYREANPERYAYICNKEEDLQLATTTIDGSCYFVVRTSKMKGLFVCVDADGKGKIVTGIDFYPNFITAPDAPRIDLPSDWEQKCRTAIRTVGQHLAKLNSYKVKDKAATNAKGIIVKMSESGQLSQHSQNLLDAAFQMVNKGNSDIIRIVNAIGREVYDNQLTLFVLTQEQIDDIIARKLDNIVSEQYKQTGTPEVYLALAK